jgi:lipopolysaccharide export system protein LptA
MNRYILLLLFFLCSSVIVYAAPAIPTIDTNLPVEIESQQLEIMQQENKSIFSGNVVATQGDMTLSADELSVFFIEENQIDRLEAVGNVRFSQLDKIATSDKAVYHQLNGVLLLIGDAKVQQGKNLVSGDEITFYVQENRSVVKGSSQQRVKAVIVQEQKKDVE